MPVMKKPGGKRVYQLKVMLRDIRPPIWRRIQVRSDTNLQRLHRIIQTVMDWHESHLHEFEILGARYGDSEFMQGEVEDEQIAKLGKLITEEKEKFLYRYDLGDCWDHEVLVEKIMPPEDGIRYPVCLAGKRACPPEDCGGAPGYEELLEILGDPSHPEHEDRFLWLPGDFDSEKFDVDSVNKRLRGTQRKRITPGRI